MEDTLTVTNLVNVKIVPRGFIQMILVGDIQPKGKAKAAVLYIRPIVN